MDRVNQNICGLICFISCSMGTAGTLGAVPMNPPSLSEGFYAGIGIGAMDLTFKTQVRGTRFPQKEVFGTDNVLGAVYAGYNRNFTPWFNLGLEGFFNFYSLSTIISGGSTSAQSTYKTPHNCGLKLLPALSLRDDLRLFVDVGANWGAFHYYPSTFAKNAGSPVKYAKTLSGFMAGLGSEVALYPHLSLRGEYQYLGYSNWDINTPLRDGRNIYTQFKNTGNQFIASLIYHFD